MVVRFFDNSYFLVADVLNKKRQATVACLLIYLALLGLISEREVLPNKGLHYSSHTLRY